MRQLIWGRTFLRGYKRQLRKHPGLADEIGETLELLARDPFSANLESHKLRGKLAGTWACTVGYDLRILFELHPSPEGGPDDVLLIDIGTHDEVY
jgi:addiction module RelE/StbE family toxin